MTSIRTRMPALAVTRGSNRRPVTRRAALLGLAPLALLALTSCGLDHGTVTGKTYEPSYVYYVPQCISYSSRGTCRLSIPVPEKQPACWRLDLRDGSDTGSTCVDQQTWDRAQIGQQYP